jgi:DNA-binding GntR family transcriptional regulator
LELHDHLRALIIDGQLEPGAIVSQAQLARTFNVSRTPMREAFRMLQEEGLIDADLNRRARVRDLDPQELDQLYAVRILLEAFGARLTAGHLSDAEVADAQSTLQIMDDAHDQGDMDTWVVAHRHFHGVCVSRADGPLLQVINSYSERSERYLRLYQRWHPQSFSVAHDEHEGILRAVVAGDRLKSAALMARHLAATALTVLHDASSETAGVAIQEALATTA